MSNSSISRKSVQADSAKQRKINNTSRKQSLSLAYMQLYLQIVSLQNDLKFI